MRAHSIPLTNFPIKEIVPLFDPLFSNLLNPPEKIWIEGTPQSLNLLERLPRDGLAIVGTRSPDRRSIFLVRETIRRVSGSHLIIISGLARGIDAIAHEAALENAIPTIAVMGCGIGKTYPAEHRALRKRILENGGLVLSEFPTDASPRPSFFVQRNRIIAGLGQAAWIVQSGYRSGALNTAHWALKQGKDLYVTPSFPGDPSFLGNEFLLRKNPNARPLWSAEDLASTWIQLFSSVESKRVQIFDPAESEPNTPEARKSRETTLYEEIDRGVREGQSLFSVLEARSARTGESLKSLIQEIEKNGY